MSELVTTSTPHSNHADWPVGGSGGVGAPSWRGTRVGRFELLDLLGKGAMATVFRALDVDLNRQVALKLISAPSSDIVEASGCVQRLLAEARAAAQLDHPHIVHIYETGVADGVYYIAMEWIECGSLQDWVTASGPMEIPRACRLICEAAEALQYAHDAGLVHRDIKPANLMLSQSGKCKLVDFGLARTIESSPDLDNDRPPVGTPLYVAPEVIRSQASTARSDLYSLAGSLWFLLTGKPPFPREMTVLVIAAHLLDPLPDLRALRRDAPEGLARAIDRAMGKDPADRFASAREFAQALQPFAAGADPPAAAAPRRWLTSRKWAVLLALLIAMIVSAVALWVWHPSGVWNSRRDLFSGRVTSEGVHLFFADDPAALLLVADGRDDDDPPDVNIAVDGKVHAIGPSTHARFFRIYFAPPGQANGFACAYDPALESAMQARFSGLQSLIGKHVRVIGKLERFKERPQITIRAPDQLQLLD